MAPTLQAEDEKQLMQLLSVLPETIPAPDCNTYRTYRPILQTALPFISKIPVFGSKIATAVTFLMTLADSVCNVSATKGALARGTSTEAEATAMELLKSSGVLNPSVTLEQLLDLQKKLKALPGGADGVVVYNSFVVSLD